jgi:hypothetical protein
MPGMDYPPPPWTLRGEAAFGVKLLPVERAKAFVPPDLHIVRVLPGYTVGGIYLASYGPGSTLEYNELIVFPALVRHNRRIGAWVSHIYVDNEESAAGGREIWGLPKEPAEFRREPGTLPAGASQDGRALCEVALGEPFPLWRQSFSGWAFGHKTGRYVRFHCHGAARAALAGVRWTVPAESPFAGLGLDRPLLSVRLSGLEFTAEAPDAA